MVVVISHLTRVPTQIETLSKLPTLSIKRPVRERSAAARRLAIALIQRFAPPHLIHLPPPLTRRRVRTEAARTTAGRAITITKHCTFGGEYDAGGGGR